MSAALCILALLVLLAVAVIACTRPLSRVVCRAHRYCQSARPMQDIEHDTMVLRHLLNHYDQVQSGKGPLFGLRQSMYSAL